MDDEVYYRAYSGKLKRGELLNGEVEGKQRVIFIFDEGELCTTVCDLGYDVIFVKSDEQLKEVESIFASANMHANNRIFACCTKSYITRRLKAALNLDCGRFINATYKLLRNRADYYRLIEHDEELKEAVAKFVSGLGLDVEDGAQPLLSDGKVDYMQTAKAAIKKYGIVQLDNCLWMLGEGRTFVPHTKAINDKKLIPLLDNSTKNTRAEVFSYISYLAPEEKVTEGYVPFKNGVFNTDNGELQPYEDNMFFTTCIPHCFNPDADENEEAVAVAKGFIDSLANNDWDVGDLLYNFISYCFVNDNPWQKTFFIYGDGGNGKGTFFNLLEAIFGKENVDYKSWKELGTDTGRFSIINKALVMCNDIDCTYIKEPQALKTLASCEPQTARQYYSDAITATFRGKIISSGNAIPRVNDSSHGWMRRLVLIPFEANFRDNPDVSVSDKITSEEVIEYFIYTSMHRLPIVKEMGFKYVPKRVEELYEEYRLDNNPVARFVEEQGDKIRGKENAKTLEPIFKMYQNFCSDNCIYSSISKFEFGKRIKAQGVIMSKPHKGSRIYYI